MHNHEQGRFVSQAELHDQAHKPAWVTWLTAHQKRKKSGTEIWVNLAAITRSSGGNNQQKYGYLISSDIKGCVVVPYISFAMWQKANFIWCDSQEICSFLVRHDTWTVGRGNFRWKKCYT